MNEAVDDPTVHDRAASDGWPATDPAEPTENTTTTEPVESNVGDGNRPDEIDLVGIEADLDGVQAALARLADGTYWTDEVTGEAIPADVLAADPLARRA